MALFQFSMKGGKIKVNKAGDETGSSMNGWEIIANEKIGKN